MSDKPNRGPPRVLEIKVPKKPWRKERHVQQIPTCQEQLSGLRHFRYDPKQFRLRHLPHQRRPGPSLRQKVLPPTTTRQFLNGLQRLYRNLSRLMASSSLMPPLPPSMGWFRVRMLSHLQHCLLTLSRRYPRPTKPATAPSSGRAASLDYLSVYCHSRVRMTLPWAA